MVEKCLTEVAVEQRVKSSEGMGHGVTGRRIWKNVFDILSCEEKSGLLNTVYNMVLYNNTVYNITIVVYSSWDGKSCFCYSSSFWFNCYTINVNYRHAFSKKSKGRYFEMNWQNLLKPSV